MCSPAIIEQVKKRISRRNALAALGGAGAAFGGGPRPTSRFFQDFTTPSDSVFGFLTPFSLVATHECPSALCHEPLSNTGRHLAPEEHGK